MRVPLLACFVAGMCACGDTSSTDLPLSAAESADDAALHGLEYATHGTDLLDDLGDFLGESVQVPFGRADGDWWQTKGDCDVSFSIGRDRVELSKDCTLPSGRHVRGTLRLVLQGNCGLRGLTLDFDLLIESAPGADDELRVVGNVTISKSGARRYLGLSIEHVSHPKDRTLDVVIAGCFVKDKEAKVIAIDAGVSVDVDQTRVHLSRIENLQHQLCETVPFTGDITVQHKSKHVKVSFDRLSPETGLVTVDANGDIYQKEVPARLHKHKTCSAPPLSAPLDIDFTTCGSCDNPAPPPPDEEVPGDGTDPPPVEPPPPPVIL